jgi:hypothetical protein
MKRTRLSKERRPKHGYYLLSNRGLSLSHHRKPAMRHHGIALQSSVVLGKRVGGNRSLKRRERTRTRLQCLRRCWRLKGRQVSCNAPRKERFWRDVGCWSSPSPPKAWVGDPSPPKAWAVLIGEARGGEEKARGGEERARVGAIVCATVCAERIWSGSIR